ncbi:viral coat protein [Poplar mosaic virus]|uniref:Capsid protein n=1 Tax=Poplar mosaic virus TaxID=12166 RepID=Q6RBY5_9VIRU|nr:viral coat protein [Poplar mosaic virus]AAR89418.1 viral coat protein [Poplar mosaic virus]AND74083.1 coat protein [Poplar mosaic virus]
MSGEQTEQISKDQAAAAEQARKEQIAEGKKAAESSEAERRKKNIAEIAKLNEKAREAKKQATEQEETTASLLERFNLLKEWHLNQQVNNKVKNPAMESETEPALADELKPDMSNLFARPTVTDLQKMKWNAESNKMATADDMAFIEAEFQSLGVPKENLAKVMWTLTRYCVGASSSQYLDPKGEEKLCGGVTRAALIASIKKRSTLSVKCADFMRPSCGITCWSTTFLQKIGSPRATLSETKFAAFDTFDFVMNPDPAIQPLEGLIRSPTKAEIIANETHKRIALDRNANNERFANLGSEITGGKFGCRVGTKWRESKCDNG